MSTVIYPYKYNVLIHSKCLSDIKGAVVSSYLYSHSRNFTPDMMTEIVSRSLCNETLGTLTIKYGFQRCLKSNLSTWVWTNIAWKWSSSSLQIIWGTSKFIIGWGNPAKVYLCYIYTWTTLVLIDQPTKLYFFSGYSTSNVWQWNRRLVITTKKMALWLVVQKNWDIYLNRWPEPFYLILENQLFFCWKFFLPFPERCKIIIYFL